MRPYPIFFKRSTLFLSNCDLVLGGYTLEICLAKQALNPGEVDLDLAVEFHGLTLVEAVGLPPRGGVTLHGSHGIARLDIASHLQKEEVNPDLKLKAIVHNFRPVESKIYPLGSRDRYPVTPPRANNQSQVKVRIISEFGAKPGKRTRPRFRIR